MNNSLLRNPVFNTPYIPAESITVHSKRTGKNYFLANAHVVFNVPFFKAIRLANGDTVWYKKSEWSFA